MPNLNIAPIQFGCDPELFFKTSEGKIVGAEHVLPKEGYLADSYNRTYKAVVLDGVQVELNPHPSYCRANLGSEIASYFRTIKRHVASKDGVKTSFDAVIKLDKVEYDKLCEKSKQLGCSPSKNIYDARATVKVSGERLKMRSAGGHLHFGFANHSKTKCLMDHRERLVALCDVIIGNTCVLIDRDPNAPLRRKYYGRAGEHRLPKYGLEYRTLSNFWLRSYPLFAMVMGLGRMTNSVLFTTLTTKWNAEADLLDRIDLKKVRKAINKNDLDLALVNWQGMAGFIKDNIPEDHGFRREMALDRTTIPYFEYFCKKIWENGIEYWFPEDPLDAWCKLDGAEVTAHSCGFESFISKTVKPVVDMRTLFKV